MLSLSSIIILSLRGTFKSNLKIIFYFSHPNVGKDLILSINLNYSLNFFWIKLAIFL